MMEGEKEARQEAFKKTFTLENFEQLKLIAAVFNERAGKNIDAGIDV